MESNHCFYSPLSSLGLSLRWPLQPSGRSVRTLHASCPSWCNLQFSVKSEDIRKAITINIRLYSSSRLSVDQPDSLTLPGFFQTPPVLLLSPFIFSA